MLLGILLLLNIVNVVLSDDRSRLTIVNKTSSYLHILIDEKLYPYVPPNKNVNYQTEPKPEFYVQIFYSPGQRKTTLTIDSLFVVSYTPGSTTAYGDECSCEDYNSDYSCSRTDRVVENPPEGGSARWEVTDADFNN